MTDSLGKYRIQAEIGKGGFATVYRALDTTLDREVALKVLDPLLARDPAWAARFQREAKTIARLKHPHIVTIYEVVEAEGRLCIAMELVVGKSLAQRITERGRLPWDESVKLLEQMAEALDYAHSQGVLHRDLKPTNILLDPRAGAVLTDFGFARLMGESSVSVSVSSGIHGTPAYIAPEVWDDQDPTRASDLYSFGCMTYEMLTGEVLFAGKTPMAVLRKHADGPIFPDPWPEGVAPEAADVLRRALAREPGDRYPSAHTFVSALKEVQDAARRHAAEPTLHEVGLSSSASVAPDLPAGSSVSIDPAESVPPNAPQQVDTSATQHGEMVAPSATGLAAPSAPESPAADRSSTETGPLQPIRRPPPDRTTPAATDLRPPPASLPGWGWALVVILLVIILAAAIIPTMLRSNGSGATTLSALAPLAGEAISRTGNTASPDVSAASAWAVGRNLLFTTNRDGKREVYRLDPDTSVIRITNTTGNAESWEPASTPDGAILFVSDRDGKREIYRLSGNGEVVRVTNTPGNAESWEPASAPDGAILFVSNRDGKREIYRLSGNGDVARVTNTSGQAESWEPAVAPDGAILFVSDRDGKREIYRLSGNGNVARVTNTLGNAESCDPASTPDGGILFTSDRTGKAEIFRLSGAGEVVQVTHTDGNGQSWHPQSTPNGDILFTSDRDGKSEVYQLTGKGVVTRLTTTASSACSSLAD